MLNRYTSNTRPFSVDLGQPKTSFLQPGLQPSHVERSSICRRFDPESLKAWDHQALVILVCPAYLWLKLSSQISHTKARGRPSH
jgi:hypothetical protein